MQPDAVMSDEAYLVRDDQRRLQTLTRSAWRNGPGFRSRTFNPWEGHTIWNPSPAFICRRRRLRDPSALAYVAGVSRVDLNYLLSRHQISLMRAAEAASAPARYAHHRLACLYAREIRLKRQGKHFGSLVLSHAF